MQPEHPLPPLKVLDLSRVLAGPFVGRMLSDLGADVVKVEPPGGDITRRWGRVVNGLSGYYTQQNAGKRNLCVDLARPGGVELLGRLAAVADVLIENFRPGVMARYGLDWPALSGANPRLVYVSISGFGQSGSQAARAAYAPILHAESGILARQAFFDGDVPTDTVLSIADTNAGLHALVGVLAALLMRERTGAGQHIDLGMLDAMMVTDDYAHFALDEGPTWRGGGEIWETRCGPIIVAGDLRSVWRQLVRIHGLEDPAEPDAPRDEKIALRRAATEAFFRAFDDRDALIAALDAANLAWGDVLTPEEAFARPIVAERGIAPTIDDRGGGTRRVVQSPYRFSGARSGVRGPAPYRGEHNAAVLGEWLGAGAAEVDALVGAGVLQAESPG